MKSPSKKKLETKVTDGLIVNEHTIKQMPFPLRGIIANCCMHAAFAICVDFRRSCNCIFSFCAVFWCEIKFTFIFWKVREINHLSNNISNSKSKGEYYKYHQR